MRRSLDQFGFLHLQGVGLDDGQAARTVVQFGQQGDEARILLDQHHLARIAFQQGASQAAGAGTDLDDGAAVEGPGVADDLPRDVQVQQEVLAEALLGRQAVGVERFTQGGQMIGHEAC